MIEFEGGESTSDSDSESTPAQKSSAVSLYVLCMKPYELKQWTVQFGRAGNFEFVRLRPKSGEMSNAWHRRLARHCGRRLQFGERWRPQHGNRGGLHHSRCVCLLLCQNVCDVPVRHTSLSVTAALSRELYFTPPWCVSAFRSAFGWTL